MNSSYSMSDEIASLDKRFYAVVIDLFVIGVIGAILAAPTGSTQMGQFAGFIVGVIYQWYFLTMQNGQTPGKRIMGIRVVKVDGTPLTTADVIIRYVGYYINSIVFFLGWIWAMFDADKQGWHDKLAGTYVVTA
jgi:uncharacterized RDD family membrane protein YckC